MTPLEEALIEAVASALILLRADRESLVETHTLQGLDGKPDLSTLDAATRPYVAEYDRAIRLCEDALQQAGLR